jgi:hypothetical protein
VRCAGKALVVRYLHAAEAAQTIAASIDHVVAEAVDAAVGFTLTFGT